MPSIDQRVGSLAVCVLSAVLVSLLSQSCASSASRLPASDASKGAIHDDLTQVSPAVPSGWIEFDGRLESYGSWPNILWMLRSQDGRLFYPVAEFQASLGRLSSGLYRWKGKALPPLHGLRGMIPEHHAAIDSLEWSRIGD